MHITLPDVPPYYDNPKLEYKAAQDIQIAFATQLSWLFFSYHIAKVGIIASDDVGYPQIHANDGTQESHDIRPDNACPSYSFLEIERPSSIDIPDDTITYFLSCVFWVDLDLVDGSKLYDYTSELIQDVVNVLSTFDAQSIDIETRPERIFDKYSGLLQHRKQHLMRRYSGFKITFSINDCIVNSCDGDPIDVCQLNVDRILNIPEPTRTCIINTLCNDLSYGVDYGVDY